MRVAIPNTERLRIDTFQVMTSFIDFLRVFYMEHSEELGIEPISIETEDIEPLLKKSKERPFDVVFSMRSVEGGPRVRHLYKKLGIKLVHMWDDLHWHTKDALQNRMSLFRDSDLVLLPYYGHFLSKTEYSKFRPKGISFPWFAPSICFELGEEWEKRYPKAMMSGRCTVPYTFREKVYRYAKYKPDIFSRLRHPGYDPDSRYHQIIGKSYYEMIAENKAAVATSADKPLDYLVCKYFEIPACGCLPFFEEVPGLEEAGFVPFEHYIPINQDDYHKKITVKCIEEGEEMAIRARDFVRKHHSEEVRARQLAEILLDNFG